MTQNNSKQINWTKTPNFQTLQKMCWYLGTSLPNLDVGLLNVFDNLGKFQNDWVIRVTFSFNFLYVLLIEHMVASMHHEWPSERPTGYDVFIESKLLPPLQNLHSSTMVSGS